MKVSFYYFAFLLFTTLHLSAQDAHFSQFYVTPSYTNPAFTGFFKGNIRAHAIYKSQWEFVTNAYSTVSTGVDFSLLKKQLKWNMLGVGFNLIGDFSGSTHLNTYNFNLPISYTQRLNKERNNFLSIGFMPSFSLKTINLSKATFDEQYDGVAGFQGAASENIFNTKTYFNIGAGMVWYNEFKKNHNFYAGLSLFNIPRPNVSLLKNIDIYVPYRVNMNMGGFFSVNKKIAFVPSLQLQQQKQFSEWLIGSFMRYNLTDEYNPQNKLNLYFGLWYRSKDAIIPTLRLDLNQTTITLNYDVNISKYSKASHGNGGPEISIIFKTINEAEAAADKRREKLGCPYF